ncbi:hypothetical protein [Sorangium sp. So ce1389]
MSKLDELTGGNLNAWATLSDEERQAVKEWMQRIGQRRGTR